MKHSLIAALVAAGAFNAATYASPLEANFGLNEGHCRFESAGEAASGRQPGWLAEVFEHVINPEILQPCRRKESS